MIYTKITKQTKATEIMIKLHIQPKPKYLPAFIWKRLIARLLIVKEYRLEVKS